MSRYVIAALCCLASGVGAGPLVHELGAQDAPPSHGDSTQTSHPSQAPHLPMLAMGAVSSATWTQIIGMPDAWPRTWRGYGNRLGDQVGFIVAEESLKAGLRTVVPWRDITGPCKGAERGRAWGARGVAAARCGVARTFVAQTAAGERRLHVPLLGAIAGATALSLAWRPERKNAGKGQAFLLTRAGIVTGATAANRAMQAWRGR